MKLYRHYKNKYYAFKGMVKHSETLEDLALYDCLYENDLGKGWVRPKELFFGDLEIDGKLKRRFEPVEIDVAVLSRDEASSKESLQMIDEVSKGLFKIWDLSKVKERLEAKKKPLLLVALVDGNLAGYKLGYELDDRTYYSWLGGVSPQWRKLGIAHALMERQHRWAYDYGFERMQTKTKNEFVEMLTLNLKAGFQIKAVQEDGKIVMEKILEKPEL